MKKNVTFFIFALCAVSSQSMAGVVCRDMLGGLSCGESRCSDPHTYVKCCATGGESVEQVKKSCGISDKDLRMSSQDKAFEEIIQKMKDFQEKKKSKTLSKEEGQGIIDLLELQKKKISWSLCDPKTNKMESCGKEPTIEDIVREREAKKKKTSGNCKIEKGSNSASCEGDEYQRVVYRGGVGESVESPFGIVNGGSRSLEFLESFVDEGGPVAPPTDSASQQ